MFHLFKRVEAVRGAICSRNVQDAMREDTLLLYNSIIEKNKIKEVDIVSVQFSLTSDLTALNPCTALRKSGVLQNVALFTSLEPDIAGGADGIIRILILYYSRLKPFYVYLKGAEKLRHLNN